MAAILNTIQGFGIHVFKKSQAMLDAAFPPEKRAEASTKLQAFAVNNPKLSFFLLSNIVLTGGPLLLFLIFSLSVFVSSLIATLLMGLLAALLFTAFMVGIALLVLVPTMFMTTFTAFFVFLWGMGGYYVLRWFNERGRPAPRDKAIGDKKSKSTGDNPDWVASFMRDNSAEPRAGSPAADKGSEGRNGNGIPSGVVDHGNGTAKLHGQEANLAVGGTDTVNGNSGGIVAPT